MKPHERIIVAVDVDTYASAEAIVKQLKGRVGAIKLGLEFACAEGWAKAAELGRQYNMPVFMDAKLKDIPNTLAGASRSMFQHGPAMLTVMADTSQAALEAVVAAKATAGVETLLVGVTVLTSLSETDSLAIYGGKPADKVRQFALTAKAAGFDAIVCSPHEATLVKQATGLIVITPGIRPAWAAAGDQSRITTPADAIRAGADRLVIGRPITQPPAEVGTPAAAVELIIKEIEEMNL